jgi:hypothetical protein
MKILLINPPNNLKDILGSVERYLSSFEPMGLLYTLSILTDTLCNSNSQGTIV